MCGGSELSNEDFQPQSSTLPYPKVVQVAHASPQSTLELLGLKPRFGHNKAQFWTQQMPESAHLSAHEAPGSGMQIHAARYCRHSTADTAQPTQHSRHARPSARTAERRGADHATRHCGDGVGGSERGKVGQIDVEVIVPGHSRERTHSSRARSRWS